MTNLEMKHLESFLAVAEEGSFTRAARRMHITQPPITLRVREVEAMLKVSLFDRTTRHVNLTHAGQVLLEKLRETMQSLSAALEAAKLAEKGIVGTLRVGYTGIASNSVLPQLLSTFSSLYPKVALDFLGPDTTGELVRALLDQEIDVALCFLPVVDKRIESCRLRATELVLALPHRHPLVRRKKISVSDLAEEMFVTYPADAGFHLRAAVDAECIRAGFRPRVVKETRWTQTLVCLVAAGMGISILPAEPRTYGKDVSIITYAYMVKKSLAAAAVLAEHGIDAEIVDVRTLRPLDLATLEESVRKTRKALVVHEAPVFGGAGAEIAAQLHREVFDYLDAPVERVGALETPVPYASVLERAYLPDEGRIIDAVGSMLHQKIAYAAAR